MRGRGLVGLLGLLLPLAPLAVAAQIAPEPTPVPWPAGDGAALVQKACLICHGGEMIASQRLTPAQWTAEVAKMTHWGAPLTAAEQQTLAAYLAAHYGPDLPRMVPRRVHQTP